MYLKKSLGFSLVELMISLALGALVIAMISGLYVSGVVNNINGLKYARLKSDLQTIMHIMETDIRRAGLRGDAISVALGTASAANPFMWSETINVTRVSGANSIVEAASAGIATKILDNGNCILFKYDVNKSGGVPESNEHFGYKVSDNTLKMASDVSASNPTNCNSGSWQAITDPSVLQVTELSFAATSTLSEYTRLRVIDITLSGKVSIDSSDATDSIKSSVQIRNLELVK